MQIRFEKFLKTLSKNRICNWDYFVNFQKVYKNIEEIKIELCILNSLIKSKNIKADFKNLIQMYPNVLKAIPTLLAIRGNNIRVGIEKERKCLKIRGRKIIKRFFYHPNYTELKIFFKKFAFFWCKFHCKLKKCSTRPRTYGRTLE